MTRLLKAPSRGLSTLFDGPAGLLPTFLDPFACALKALFHLMARPFEFSLRARLGGLVGLRAADREAGSRENKGDEEEEVGLKEDFFHVGSIDPFLKKIHLAFFVLIQLKDFRCMRYPRQSCRMIALFKVNMEGIRLRVVRI